MGESTNVNDGLPDVERLLDKARRLHESGSLDEAQVVYRAILDAAPATPDALHLLGVLMQQRGRFDIAESLIRAALALESRPADYWYHLGAALAALGKTRAAVDAYRAAVDRSPGEVDYLMGFGNALLAGGNPGAAAEAFRTALGVSPADPDLQFNLGSALADSGEFEAAIEHYRRALQQRPDDVQALVNLGMALERVAQADEALGCYERACAADPELGVAHYQRGVILARLDRIDDAIDAQRAAIDVEPDNADAQVQLATLLGDQGRFMDAVGSLRTFLDLHSDSVKGWVALGRVLRLDGRFESALECFGKAAGLDPEYPDMDVYIGVCLNGLGRTREAIAALERAVARNPESAEAHYNLAGCYQALGRFSEAGRHHGRALAVRPDLGEAAYNLVSIESGAGGDISREELECRADDREVDSGRRAYFQFALGKLRERAGEYDRAFQHYHCGNRLHAALQPFDPLGFEDYIARIIELFRRDFFDSRRGYGSSSDTPVFIVGMPRSGSTLVEQILAGHPHARGVGELDTVRAMVRSLRLRLHTSTPLPGCIAEVGMRLSQELAAEYLATLPAVPVEVRRVCDKMLGNFLRLGLIALLFPDSRVIHCMRDPLDTCVSCYFQHFAQGLKFSYDLAHLGTVYRLYVALMQHWKQVLPLPILDVRYERLVIEPEAVSRELTAFCGLQWDPRCVAFQDRVREVRTASFWQVRQPVYQSSVGRWRHYRKHLQPLLEALGELAGDKPSRQPYR